jgi:hypothetical protein
LGQKIQELDKSGVLAALRSHTTDRARRAEMADELERQLQAVSQQAEAAQVEMAEMTTKLVRAERERAAAVGTAAALTDGMISLGRFLVAAPAPSNGRMGLVCKVDPDGDGSEQAPVWRLTDSRTGGIGGTGGGAWELPTALVPFFREHILSSSSSPGA